MSDVTVLIRTLNEADHLDETLSAVVNQLRVNASIVVVDSHSDDDTVEIARSYNATVVQVPREEFTFGKGLNVGLEIAETRYVAPLSAHAVPTTRSWLEHLLEGIEEDSVAGAYGRQIAGLNANPLERRELLDNYGTVRREQVTDPYFSNANSIIDCRVWEKIPFDEQLPASEDREWASEVQEEGYKIIYIPDATVKHTHEDSLKSLYSRNYIEGRALNHIENDRSVSLTSLFGGSMLETIRDAKFIIQKQSGWSYLIYSPIYRFTQQLGRWGGYHGR
jgi:glycosyltransferase involved in cell wall biosynthesis